MPEQVPSVVHQPAATAKLQRGIGQLAALIRPTMGPRPRHVAVDSTYGMRAPEILDSGGLIARRMLSLSDVDEDMGAMLLRNLLWRVHETLGDGTATTCVLFQSIFDQGVQHLAAGVNSQELRKHLLGGLEAVVNELNRSTMRVKRECQLVSIAERLCLDPPLARALGELVAVTGEHGNLEVRPGHSRQPTWTLIEGAYWKAPVLSRLMLADEAGRRVDLTQCHILYSDLDITDPSELLRVIDTAKRDGANGLIVVARSVAEPCLATLLRNGSSPAFPAIAVRTPDVSPSEQQATLDDIQALTGGRALRQAAGDTLAGFRRADFGQCRRAWADRQYFGIIGGKGDPRRLRRRVAALRAQHQASDDHEARTRTSQRIGNLSGASAIVSVGDAGSPAFETRKQTAARTSVALQAILRDGVVAGAGAALLACRPRLASMLAHAHDASELAAYQTLMRALEAPTRTIATNAGLDPGTVLLKLEQAGAHDCFDVLSGTVVNAEQVGLLDSASVVTGALTSAVRSAAQALTIDVLVHRRNPEESMHP